MGSGISKNKKYAKGSSKVAEINGRVYPPYFLDQFDVSTFSKNDTELAIELQYTPAHYFGIDLTTVQPTSIKVYDTEETLQKKIGDFIYTLPKSQNDTPKYDESIPKYKKVEWLKEYVFPSGYYTVLKYKPEFYPHMEYFIKSHGAYHTGLMFPPNMTHESLIRMTLSHRTFNPINSLTIIMRLYEEHTQYKISLSHPIKLWKIRDCYVEFLHKYTTECDYRGILPLSRIMEYHP